MKSCSTPYSRTVHCCMTLRKPFLVQGTASLEWRVPGGDRHRRAHSTASERQRAGLRATPARWQRTRLAVGAAELGQGLLQVQDRHCPCPHSCQIDREANAEVPAVPSSPATTNAAPHERYGKIKKRCNVLSIRKKSWYTASTI